MQIIMLIA